MHRYISKLINCNHNCTNVPRVTYVYQLLVLIISEIKINRKLLLLLYMMYVKYYQNIFSIIVEYNLSIKCKFVLVPVEITNLKVSNHTFSLANNLSDINHFSRVIYITVIV